MVLTKCHFVNTLCDHLVPPRVLLRQDLIGGPVVTHPNEAQACVKTSHTQRFPILFLYGLWIPVGSMASEFRTGFRVGKGQRLTSGRCHIIYKTAHVRVASVGQPTPPKSASFHPYRPGRSQRFPDVVHRRLYARTVWRASAKRVTLQSLLRKVLVV